MEIYKKISRMLALLCVAWGLASCGTRFSPLNAVNVPPVHSSPPGLIEDWETNDTTNHLGGVNSVNSDNYTLGGISMFANYFVPGSTLLGGTPGHAVEITGSEGPQVAPYPYAEFELGMNPSTGMDIQPLTPTHRLVFSYKAGTKSLGNQINVNFNDATIKDYSWYYYTFYPADTNWHQVVIYLPGSGGSPIFKQQTWGSPQVPWSQVVTNITELVFFPVSSASQPPTPYDITFDDIYFE